MLNLTKRKSLILMPVVLLFVLTLFIVPCLANHEPPIGFGTGSFYIDIPNGIKLVLDGTEDVYGAGEIYYKYRLENPESEYLAVSALEILTEKRETGKPSYEKRSISADQVAKVKLWLTRNFDKSPEVILQGKEDGVIYSKVKLTRFNNSGQKTVRSTRYYYGSEADHSIQLQKWQVIADKEDRFNSADKGIYSDQDQDQDLFYLYVYLAHKD